MKIWAWGLLLVGIWNTFGLEHVKVIFGSFRVLFPKLGCSSKTASHRVKWMKLWDCMWYAYGYF